MLTVDADLWYALAFASPLVPALLRPFFPDFLCIKASYLRDLPMLSFFDASLLLWVCF